MTYPAMAGGTRLFYEDWATAEGARDGALGAVQVADRGLWWLGWRKT